MEENINDPHENFLMTVRMAEGFENKPAHRSEMRGVALLEEMKELDEDDDLPSSVFKIVAQQKDRLLEDISARERVDLLYVKNIKADFKRMIEEVVENNLTKVTDIIDKYEKIYERYCQKLDEYECQVLNDLETKVLKDLKTKVYSEEQADDERSDSENEILLEAFSEETDDEYCDSESEKEEENVTPKVYTLRCTSVSSESSVSSVSSDSDSDVEVLTKDVGQQTDVVDTADKGVQTDFIDDDDDEGTDYYDVEDKGVQANFDNYYYYDVEDKGVQTEFIDDDNDNDDDEEVTDDVDITNKGFQADFIDDDDDEDDEVNLNFPCVEADDGSTKNLQKEKIDCIIIKATKGCGTDDYESDNDYYVKVGTEEAVDLEDKELVAHISDIDQHLQNEKIDCIIIKATKGSGTDDYKSDNYYDVKVEIVEDVDLEDKELVAYISDTDQHSDADVCKTEQHLKSNEGDEPKLEDELTSQGYDVKVEIVEDVDLEDKELVAYISDTDQHSDADVCKIEHHRKSNEGDEPKLEDELTSQGSECSSFEICSYSESDDCDSSISKKILTFETSSNREEHSTLENGTRQVENQPNFDNASKKPKEGKEYEEEFLNDPGRLSSDASRNSDTDEEFLKDVVVLNESDLPPLEEDLPHDSVSPEERGAKADDASKGHGGEHKDSEPSGHKDSEPSSYFSSFCKTIGLS